VTADRVTPDGVTGDGVLVQSAGDAHWAWVGLRLRPAPDDQPESAWARETERAWLAGQWATEHGARWELRYRNNPADRTVTATLLGRVHGRDLAGVRAAALALRDRLAATPRHVRAEPIQDADEVRAALTPNPPHPAGFADLRKPLTWAWSQRGDTGRRVCVGIGALAGEDRSWQPVWSELARLDTPTTVGVYLEPYQPAPALTARLRGLATEYAVLASPRVTNALWQVGQPADPVAAAVAPGYADAAQRYTGRCFRLRISVLSQGPLPAGFAELLAHTVGGAAVVHPAPAERTAAYQNVAALNREWLAETCAQGTPPGELTDVERVLSDLVDVSEAATAFRLPRDVPDEVSPFTGHRGPTGFPEVIEPVTEPGTTAEPGARRTRLFVSYLRHDVELVDRLVADLRAAGYEVWVDRGSLRPGQRWRTEVRRAIQRGDHFLACFSAKYAGATTYMNEELIMAVDRLRLMPRDRAWFIPVLLDRCELPDLQIGPGETLADLQCVDLTGDWDAAVRQLVSALGAP
jgi:hypothetical protein